MLYVRYSINHIIIKGTGNEYDNQSMMKLNKKDFLELNDEFCLKRREGQNHPKIAISFLDENLQLVNHEANSVSVDVVPHVDNPTFEEDETPDQETAVREIKS